MSNLSFDEEDSRFEIELMLSHCMSCVNFKSFMGESGICKLNQTCPCKDPKTLIDMWDNKCEKWVISDDYKKALSFK